MKTIEIGIVAALLVSCGTPSPVVPVPAFTVTPIPTATMTLTYTSVPVATAVPSQPPTPSPTAVILARCSPLEGIALSALPSMVSNPYHPPAPGSDDAHQGIDLAILSENSQIALSGHAVNAIMAGKVVMILQDRFPYGNAVLIETPIHADSSDFWDALALPTLAPTLPPHSALTCPPLPPQLQWHPSRRSLYTLYAHLESVDAALAAGDVVLCGKGLGKVGASGNALNPHLHVEMRIGPAEATFTSMAHYDVSASPAEMAAYCVWRVSDVFQRVDPFTVLPSSP